jgi:phosphoglycolate phosphatase
MNYKYKLVLFDFDYTLADSSKGATSCINYALGKMGLDTVSDEIACRTIGLSLSNTFVQICNENQIDKINEFTGLFIKHADEVMVNFTKIYDSVPETMRILKSKGIKLGIISSKFRYRIEEILVRAGLQNTFDYIVGGEDVICQKPSPEGVIKAIEFFNLKLEEVLYVGDSLTDAETAKNAGVNFIATLTGVTKKEEFNDFNVYTYIDEISEIIGL